MMLNNSYYEIKNIDALKIQTSSIMIIGLQGYISVEIAKNLLKNNISKLYLYDSNVDNYNDINKIKSILIKDLYNKSSQIEICKDYININTDIIIIINQSIEFIIKVNTYSRKNNIKLISILSGGISGIIFIDAIQHQVNIIDEKKNDAIQLSHISSNGIVKCISNHNFSSNDIITIYNIDGINLDELNKEWKINVIDNITFQLQDFSIKSFNFYNGTTKKIIKPIIINYESFEQHKDTTNDLIKTYIQLYTNKLINKMPFIWSNELDIFMKTYNIILPEYAKTFNYELINVSKLMATLSSLEIIKLLTNKYIPINQWFTWCEPKLIPSKPINYNNNILGILYGNNFEDKLNNTQILISDFDEFEDIIKSTQINNIYKFNNNIKLNNNSSCIFNIIKSKENKEYSKNINEYVFKYNIPLFECNIDNNKGNIQPIIPYITDIESVFKFDEENSYPLCVINSFPNDMNHTIQWAFNEFEFFNKYPQRLNRSLFDENYLETLSTNDKELVLKDISLYFKYEFNNNREYNLELCTKYAIDIFIENFYTLIIKLLDTFKSDYEITLGILYWSGGKRCPKPIIFDSTNKLHLNYIKSTINMLLLIYNFDYKFTLDELKPYINNYIISINYDTQNNIILDIDNLKNKIKLSNRYNNLIEQKFDKNNNLHFEWIITSANLRALNYGIDFDIQSSIEYTNFSNIVSPFLISIFINLGIIELFKYILYNLNNSTENIFKISNVDITKSIINQYNTKEAPILQIINNKFNIWEKFTYTKNSTLEEFKLYYENIFKTKIDMIVIHTSIIYADFIQDKLNELLNDITDNLKLDSDNILVTLISNEDIEFPIINLNF